MSRCGAVGFDGPTSSLLFLQVYSIHSCLSKSSKCISIAQARKSGGARPVACRDPPPPPPPPRSPPSSQPPSPRSPPCVLISRGVAASHTHHTTITTTTTTTTISTFITTITSLDPNASRSLDFLLLHL